jgi:hypothetical protein
MVGANKDGAVDRKIASPRDGSPTASASREKPDSSAMSSVT